MVRRSLIANAMVAAAFFVYALGVLTLHAGQRNEFVPERSSIAAAASNMFYGASFGQVYGGVLTQFLDLGVPLETSLERVRRQQVEKLDLFGSTWDGNGIGYNLVISVSFRLFGPQMSSAVYFMLALMAISAVALVWRFRVRGAVVAVLYFTTLTVMLFTPTVWHQPYALNMTIGGIRYFSLVAVLPGFHLLLELADARQKEARLTAKFLTMSLQTLILVLAVLVRNSAAIVIVAIGFVWLVLECKNCRRFIEIFRLATNAICMTIVTLIFVSFLLHLVPRDYMSAGRFTETIWHRVFVSLGTSPEWPFGNVHDLYDCRRDIPEGIVSGTEDRNGHCVWRAYAIHHGISGDSVGQLTYGRLYDAALREAFFNVARAYPAQTIKAFVYYKPLLMFQSIGENFELRLTQAAPRMLLLLAASLCNFLAFALVASTVVLWSEVKIIAGATVALAVFITIPYFIVWAMPHTNGDLLLYLIFAVGLAAFAVLKALCGLLSASALPAEPGLPHAVPPNGSEADRAEPHDDIAAAANTYLLAYAAAGFLTLISQTWLWFSECGIACAVSFAKTALVWSVIWPLSWMIFLAKFF